MTYLERTINGKIIYGWGSIETPESYRMFPCLRKRITWEIGPFVKEMK